MTTRVLLVLATTLAATTAVYGANAKANIPFEFSVGRTVMPAGAYTFDTNVHPGVVRVRSADSKHAALVITNSGKSKDANRATIEFNQYGKVYFLSAVRYAGGTARELMPTPREKELRASAPVVKKVLLAAK